MTPSETAALIDSPGGLLAVLRAAEPNDKSELYRELGVSVTYQHVQRLAVVEVAPRLPVDLMGVSEGGLDPYPRSCQRADVRLRSTL